MDREGYEGEGRTSTWPNLAVSQCQILGWHLYSALLLAGNAVSLTCFSCSFWISNKGNSFITLYPKTIVPLSYISSWPLVFVAAISLSLFFNGYFSYKYNTQKESCLCVFLMDISHRNRTLLKVIVLGDSGYDSSLNASLFIPMPDLNLIMPFFF